MSTGGPLKRKGEKPAAKRPAFYDARKVPAGGINRTGDKQVASGTTVKEGDRGYNGYRE